MEDEGEITKEMKEGLRQFTRFISKAVSLKTYRTINRLKNL